MTCPSDTYLDTSHNIPRHRSDTLLTISKQFTDTHKTVTKFQTCLVGKQSQLLIQPTEVELGLQAGVEFDKNVVILILMCSLSLSK